MEVELKLLVDPQFHEALRQHPLLCDLATSSPHELTLTDTYFDAPGLTLRHRDTSLRVRHSGSQWIQNLKSGTIVHSGLHTRNEWESTVAGPVPELKRLRSLVHDRKTRRALLGAAGLGKRLKPVFSTNVKRREWEIQLQEGDQICCALDHGMLRCGQRHVPISELELELKSGDPAHLFDVALALQRDIPMHIAMRSKADRGYDLLAASAPRAMKASELTLSGDVSAEQAFQMIAFNCLAQIQGNENGVSTGADVESLHQMRVGIRRLRSALGLFSKMLHLPEELQAELDWLADALGAARDWDVLATLTLPALGKLVADTDPIDAVQSSATGKAMEQHNRVAEAVRSDRYTRLMLSLARWLQSMAWHADRPGPPAHSRLNEKVKQFADDTLKRGQRRLRTRGNNLRHASPEVRHRVRIAAKKARYAAEFFGSLFLARPARPYIKALAGLQDELGFLNDAAVANRLLGELATDQPQLAEHIGFVKGLLAARVQNEGKAINEVWKKFTPVKLPH